MHDVDPNDPACTVKAMCDKVRQSEIFIVLYSEGYFESEFCCAEVGPILPTACDEIRLAH